MNKNILIVDDEFELRNLIQRLLQLEGYHVLMADSAEEALNVLEKNDIDIIISDVKLPGKSGLELLPIIKEKYTQSEVIILTAYGRIEDGVNAIKAGAFDYIVKGDEDNKLVLVVNNAYEKVKLKNRVSHLEQNISSKYSFNSITGASVLIKNAIHVAEKIANSDTPILLVGETGTGKEVFAQSIHYESQRRKESFVAVNCSGFAKDLLESEMFGYKAGAFTGATKPKKGLFEEADRGTLFLDEIGDMDIVLQSKLLRVLENNTFIKAGDTKETKVNVRIIAATNKNLAQLIEQGKFRDDLFFRISVVQIKLPALRERLEDIIPLTDNFINVFTQKLKKDKPQIDTSFYAKLKAYSFPGNTRELKNIIERIILLSDKKTLTADDLPIDVNLYSTSKHSASSQKLEQVEKNHILSVLKSVNNNKNAAAEILGIGLTTLYRKLNEYGFDED